MAVVTSSVPLGGDDFDSDGGSAVRARRVDSASEGAPARTGRGPCGERGSGGFAAAYGAGLAVAALAVAALAFGFAAVFRFDFAAAFGFAFVAVPPPEVVTRSLPNRVGRVAGRLPRTLSSSVFSLIF
jgi:hypothetical protein